MPEAKHVFLSEKDRAGLVRLARARDRKVRDLQDAANKVSMEYRNGLDAILDRYDLPFEPKDVDLTTGEVYATVEKPGATVLASSVKSKAR